MDPRDDEIDELEQALLDIKHPADVNKVTAEVTRRSIRFGIERCQVLVNEGLTVKEALYKSEQETDAQYEHLLRAVLTEYGHL